jgi:hypothetical protein
VGRYTGSQEDVVGEGRTVDGAYLNMISFKLHCQGGICHSHDALGGTAAPSCVVRGHEAREVADDVHGVHYCRERVALAEEHGRVPIDCERCFNVGTGVQRVCGWDDLGRESAGLASRRLGQPIALTSFVANHCAVGRLSCSRTRAAKNVAALASHTLEMKRPSVFH